MITLDTNVISEPMKASAEPAVQSWLVQRCLDAVWHGHVAERLRLAAG